MNDQQMMETIAKVARVSDEGARTLDLGAIEGELFGQIISGTPVGGPSEIATAPAHVRRRAVPRGRWRAVGAAATVAAAIGLGVVVITRHGADVAFAAEDVRFAQMNERLVVDLPGWKMAYADELTVDAGETEFANGAKRATILWHLADGEYQHQLDDLAAAEPTFDVTVVGRAAKMFGTTGTTEWRTIVSPRDGHYIEIRADLGDERAYRELLAGVKSVSVDAWLRALPASAVTPSDRARAVKTILQDVPMPAGLDVGQVAESTTTSDHYQLVVLAVNRVVCGWVDRWLTAKDAADSAAQAAAATALKSSHQWPALLDIEHQGGYAGAVWEIADAANGGPGILTGGGYVPLSRESVSGFCGASTE